MRNIPEGVSQQVLTGGATRVAAIAQEAAVERGGDFLAILTTLYYKINKKNSYVFVTNKNTVG